MTGEPRVVQAPLAELAERRRVVHQTPREPPAIAVPLARAPER